MITGPDSLRPTGGFPTSVPPRSHMSMFQLQGSCKTWVMGGPGDSLKRRRSRTVRTSRLNSKSLVQSSTSRCPIEETGKYETGSARQPMMDGNYAEPSVMSPVRVHPKAITLSPHTIQLLIWHRTFLGQFVVVSSRD